MKLDRREFLKWSSLGLSAAGISSHAFADKAYRVERRDSPSILQGATDQTMTQFSVVHHSKNLNFLIKDSTGRTKLPDAVYEMQRPGLEKMIYKVLCSGLQLGEDYQLLVIEESTQDVIDTRTFSTLDTTSDQLRFAICSCMDEFKHSPHIWKDLVLQAPDFILFVGDSTYVDYGPGPEMGPDRLWQRFAEARSVLDIYFSQKLIPLLAIWDDHDFGKNDSGKEFPFLKESQENFLSFFALDEGYASCMARGPGVSSSLRLGRQQFLLMDDRSFRVAGFSKERYAHWGQEQEEWMIERLTEHIGPSWIINGSQIFPQMIFKQSYSGEHPVQFAALKEHLRQIPSKVIFISGDVHFSEISRIESEAFGYSTYEFTSSSIHSQKIPGAPGIIKNPRRVASTGKNNYLLVSSHSIGNGCRGLVESRSPNDKINFSYSFDTSEL